jgi:hypothetical protein
MSLQPRREKSLYYEKYLSNDFSSVSIKRNDINFLIYINFFLFCLSLTSYPLLIYLYYNYDFFITYSLIASFFKDLYTFFNIIYFTIFRDLQNQYLKFINNSEPNLENDIVDNILLQESKFRNIVKLRFYILIWLNLLSYIYLLQFIENYNTPIILQNKNLFYIIVGNIIISLVCPFFLNFIENLTISDYFTWPENIYYQHLQQFFTPRTHFLYILLSIILIPIALFILYISSSLLFKFIINNPLIITLIFIISIFLLLLYKNRNHIDTHINQITNSIV